MRRSVKPLPTGITGSNPVPWKLTYLLMGMEPEMKETQKNNIEMCVSAILEGRTIDGEIRRRGFERKAAEEIVNRVENSFKEMGLTDHELIDEVLERFTAEDDHEMPMWTNAFALLRDKIQSDPKNSVEQIHTSIEEWKHGIIEKGDQFISDTLQGRKSDASRHDEFADVVLSVMCDISGGIRERTGLRERRRMLLLEPKHNGLTTIEHVRQFFRRDQINIISHQRESDLAQELFLDVGQSIAGELTLNETTWIQTLIKYKRDFEEETAVIGVDLVDTADPENKFVTERIDTAIEEFRALIESIIDPGDTFPDFWRKVESLDDVQPEKGEIMSSINEILVHKEEQSVRDRILAQIDAQFEENKQQLIIDFFRKEEMKALDGQIVRLVIGAVAAATETENTRPEREAFLNDSSNAEKVIDAVTAFVDIMMIKASDSVFNENILMELLVRARFEGKPVRPCLIKSIRWAFPNRTIAILPSVRDVTVDDIVGNPIERREIVEKEKIVRFKEIFLDPLSHSNILFETPVLLAVGDFELDSPANAQHTTDSTHENALACVDDLQVAMREWGVLRQFKIITFKDVISEFDEMFGEGVFEKLASTVQTRLESLLRGQGGRRKVLGVTSRELSERMIDHEHRARANLIRGWTRENSKQHTLWRLSRESVFAFALHVIENGVGNLMITVSGNKQSGRTLSLAGLFLLEFRPEISEIIGDELAAKVQHDFPIVPHTSVNDGDISDVFKKMTDVNS